MHSHQNPHPDPNFCQKIHFDSNYNPAQPSPAPVSTGRKNGEREREGKNKRQRCGYTIYCFYRKTDDKCNKSALVLLNSIFGKLSQRKITERMHTMMTKTATQKKIWQNGMWSWKMYYEMEGAGKTHNFPKVTQRTQTLDTRVYLLQHNHVYYLLVNLSFISLRAIRTLLQQILCHFCIIFRNEFIQFHIQYFKWLCTKAQPSKNW